MKISKIAFLFFIIFYSNILLSQGNVYISEVAPTNTTCDWIEICYKDLEKTTIDVSSLYVSTCYGVKQNIASKALTLLSYDDVNTKYDDRFLVVCFGEGITETDDIGDANGNGIREAFCVNNTAPWSTEGAIAIHTSIDYKSGIIDFFVYDANDTLGSTVLARANAAIANGAWQGNALCVGENFPAYKSIIRIGNDTNTYSDFCITSVQTMGRENKKCTDNVAEKILSVKKNYIINKTSNQIFFNVYVNCSLKIKIFSASGAKVYAANVLKDVSAGKACITLPNSVIRKMKTGLYIGVVCASSTEVKSATTKKFAIVVNKL